MRLRTLHTIVLAAALAALTAAAGCDGDQRRDNGRIRIQPTSFVPPEARHDLFQLEFYFITERLSLDQAPLDFWKVLDESDLPAAHRKTLADNGLRFGLGGELAMTRINAMLTGRGNVEVQKSGQTFVRQGYPYPMPFGVAQADLPLLALTAGGTLFGGEYALASTFFSFECLSGEQPNAIDVLIGQWILYGTAEPMYRITPTGGATMVTERPQFFFDDLKTRCHLREGQILAIGLVGGHSLSIGEHMLSKFKHPYRYVTTIILAPRLVAPGAVPPGASVAGQASGGPAGEAGPAGGDK